MTPEQTVEFVDGEIIMHSPAGNTHPDVTKFILLLIDLHVRRYRLGEMKSGKCLVAFPRYDYEPAIVYFGEEKAAQLRPETARIPIPDFEVEVLSESTEKRDRGIKLEEYAAHGLLEYWIVDAESGVVEQYLLPDGDYHLEVRGSSGEIRSEVVSGFCEPIRAIFRADDNLAVLQALLLGAEE